MFAILEILPKDNSRFARFRERFSPPQIYLQEIRSDKHLPYYIIRCQERHKGIPWQEIENMAGACKTRMLIQSNIKVPEDTKIEAYRPEYLPIKILFNTAKHLLEGLDAPPTKLHCSVLDEMARASDLIEGLILLTQTLSVYTINNKKYLETAKELYDKYGISIIVSDDKSSLGESVLTLSLEKELGTSGQKGFILGFYKSKNKKVLALGKVLVPDDFYLPPIENISRFDYLCALFELCMAKSLEDVYCQTLFYDGMELSIKAAADLIKDTCHLE